MKTTHIAFTNRKGGVGKTTTAISFAIILSQLFNKKVCLVDCDQQANTTKMFVQKRELIEAHQLTDLVINYGGEFSSELLTLSHLLTNRERDIFKIVRKTKYERLDIVPSDLELSLSIKYISSSAKHLKRMLNPLNGVYDFVLYDCAPGTDVLLSNILATSDIVLVPFQPEEQSIDGMNKTVNFINETQELDNPSLQFKVFLTMIDKRIKKHRDFVEDFPRVDDNLNAKVFNHIEGKHRVETIIRRQTSPIENSTNNNEEKHFTLLTGSKRPPVADDYYKLVEEVLGGIE